MYLHPHGYHDSVIGVAKVKEKKSHIAASDHFGGREASRNWHVFQPYR
jgi:hypothetical protein